MTGYFYLSRGLFEHPLFVSNDPFSQREAWIWLIEHANFATQQFRVGLDVFEVPRGSIGTHYRELARQFRWSVNRVIRVLNLFQKQGMIVLKTEQQWIQVTLCNYERYQDRRNGDGTATEQRRDSNGTATDTKISKERKESKERKDSFSVAQGAPATNSTKGKRLSPDWRLPSEWGHWAMGENLTREEVLKEQDKFRDYWIARPGSGAVKADWQATWRNWIRKYLEDRAK